MIEVLHVNERDPFHKNIWITFVHVKYLSQYPILHIRPNTHSIENDSCGQNYVIEYIVNLLLFELLTLLGVIISDHVNKT